MNSDLFEKAKELGEMIVRTEEYTRMIKAREAFDADEDARVMLSEIEKLRDEFDRNEDEITPEDMEALRTNMREVKHRVDDNKVIMEMQAAREIFSELLNEVNQVIRFVITGEASSPIKNNSDNMAQSRQVH